MLVTVFAKKGQKLRHGS